MICNRIKTPLVELIEASAEFLLGFNTGYQLRIQLVSYLMRVLVLGLHLMDFSLLSISPLYILHMPQCTSYLLLSAGGISIIALDLTESGLIVDSPSWRKANNKTTKSS